MTDHNEQIEPEQPGQGDTDHIEHHVVQPRVYVYIFLALLVGTAITTAMAFINLGRLNPIIALAIACTKAVLVILFFMHVKYSPRLTWAVVLGGIFWPGILLTLTMSDYLTRVWRTYG
jgi:cytochrome c oxidase subunit 4